MRKCSVINTSKPFSIPLTVEFCDAFSNRFLGLMFRQNLASSEGILLVEPSESRLNSAIHMLFMNFDIAVIWLDSNYQVVDLKIARRWSLAHVPARSAQFTLEIHPTRLSDFAIGDKLILNNV